MKRCSQRRKGQAMVEFAIIALVLTLILAGGLGLAIMLLQATTTQSVAVSASMLLDEVIPYDPALSDEEEVYAQLRSLGLYDDDRLILTAQEYRAARDGSAVGFPRLNQKMLALYQWDIDRKVYRYPGAVMQYNGGSAILIPEVQYGATQTITAWHRPVEVRLNRNSSGVLSRSVDIVIRMASQPGTLMSYPTDGAGQANGIPYTSDDSAVVQSAALPAGFAFDTEDVSEEARASTNRGDYGLGEVYAYAAEVRPFRRVIQSEGTFRLEEPAGSTPGSN